MTSLPRPKPVATDEKRHVIAEYKHRAQQVTCVCGWQGSSAVAADGRTSEWSEHLAAHRP